MSQARQVFKNTVVLAASRLVDLGSSTLLIFFVSRIFHASGLGTYSTCITFYGLIGLAGEMGSTNLIVREIGKDRTKTNSYVLHLGTMAAAIGAVVTVVASIVLPHLGYSSELENSLRVTILACIPGTLGTIQEAVIVAYQRTEFATYTSLIKAIVNISVGLYLLTHGYGIVSLLVAFVAIQFVVMICYFFFINRYIVRLRWEFQLSVARRLIREMRSFAGSSIVAGLFSRPEIIILSFVRSPAQIGLYAAAFKLVDLWQIIPVVYMFNVFPVLSRSFHVADHQWQRIQDKSITFLLAASLPLTAGIAATAGPLVRLLFGPGFEQAVPLLRILALYIPLISLNSIYWRVLSARGQQHVVLQVQIITTAVRLGGGYLLIVWLGPLGAALSTVGIIFVHNWLLSLQVKSDGTRIPLLRLSWRLAAAALGMGVLTYVLERQSALSLWELVPVAGAVYLVLVVLFKAFSQEDISLLRSIWQPKAAP